MYLVETDVLYSLLYRQDALNQTAKDLFNKTTLAGEQIALSTLALVELDLTTKSNQLVFAGDRAEIFEKIIGHCSKYGVMEVAITAQDAIQSIRFREKYGLSFFDSYYAAQAYRIQAELVSFDKEYSKVAEIRHTKPEEAIRKTG